MKRSTITRRTPMNRGKGFTARLSLQPKEAGKDTESGESGETGLQPQAGRRGKPLRAKVDPKLAAWSRAVKKRDGFTCQWPKCGKFGLGQGIIVDAHHKALRSARPDLKYELSNGVTVCRAHHDHIHGEGRDEAVGLRFLNLETYEKVMKQNNSSR